MKCKLMFWTMVATLLAFSCKDGNDALTEDPAPTVRFTITYDGNGHTGGTAPVDTTGYKEGDKALIKSHGDLLKKGYYFTSWNTDRGHWTGAYRRG